MDQGKCVGSYFRFKITPAWTIQSGNRSNVNMFHFWLRQLNCISCQSYPCMRTYWIIKHIISFFLNWWWQQLRKDKFIQIYDYVSQVLCLVRCFFTYILYIPVVCTRQLPWMRDSRKDSCVKWAWCNWRVWYPSAKKIDELVDVMILLMEEILHHLGYIDPCKQWDILRTSTGAGFLPSTVLLNIAWICETHIYILLIPLSVGLASMSLKLQEKNMFQYWNDLSEFHSNSKLYVYFTKKWMDSNVTLPKFS